MTQLEYAAKSNRSIKVPIKVLLITVVGAWAMLLVCYVLDGLSTCYTKFFTFDPTSLLFICPLLLGATCFWTLRKERFANRLAWSLGCMVSGTILTEILLLTIYTPLHTSMVGSGIAR